MATKNVLSRFKEVRGSIIDPIQLGFFEMKKIKILYLDSNNKKTIRVIEPHYLLLSHPIWYVHSWELHRGEIRTFRFDRIIICTVLDEHFIVRDKEKFGLTIKEFFEEV